MAELISEVSRTARLPIFGQLHDQSLPGRFLDSDATMRQGWTRPDRHSKSVRTCAPLVLSWPHGSCSVDAGMVWVSSQVEIYGAPLPCHKRKLLEIKQTRPTATRTQKGASTRFLRNDPLLLRKAFCFHWRAVASSTLTGSHRAA